uniref:HNH nuclease domain-containing protein n=1 Tax=Arthrobacter rhombi TaxID=71253 RepID=G8DC55_9MICC|nr:hypothetical protein [Arthrobacter rhombi]
MCSRVGCDLPARSRNYCATHARGWLRLYDGDRCDWSGCNEILAYDVWWQPRHLTGPSQGKLKKIDGRTMDTGQGRLSYCRWHEVEHLRPSPKIEALNRSRLGAGLVGQGDCWMPKESIPSHKNGAAKFAPEGSNGVLEWAYHRAVWDLLMGGHRQRQELDHLTGCQGGARCAAPFHLQPVTHAENMSRRRFRNEAKKAGNPFTPNRCGPPLNLQAVGSMEVQVFAVEFELPLP